MRRFSKTALSLLISLLIVLGQLPWISITVHAEPTEELLTTITATGQEQASYSTENVATISFSYTANGSSSYYAGWGWWGYGWIATVTPADGYKITKCVFYDDANRTATDSEAPFVVKTTEEDKEPQVNGTPILAYQSKGIKKIEVYGYATSAASYSVTYNTNGGTINSGNITEYTEGTGATLPTDVTKEGYVFVGWYDNESLTGSSVSEISETDTGDKEYWAMWVESLVGKTYPVDGTGNLVIERATRFADGQGSTATVPSGTYAISFDNLTDSTCLYRLSGNRIYIANDTTKRIKALTIVEGTGLPGNPYVFAFLYDNPISITVNFSVVNGLWDDGTTTDKTVTLTGYEGDTLQLAAGQIPAVGSNPDVTYKAGSWDTTPTAGMEITADTTFTYTYAAKTPISYTVTFNVENGSWDEGGSDAQTVTLTGYEGDTLTLAASQIPAVGSNPDATYKAGSWDTTPTAGMEITADTTFTYTYAAKTPISYTVTFNVENGSWNNGGSDAQTVTLTGYEGDTLTLAASQIPAVGSNPDATYKAGSWDTTPTAGMEITADTTFTYTYAAKTPISYTVTFNVENGSWNNGGSDAQTVTLTGYEGDTLTLAASQIPAVGSNPDATYKAGSWDTTPTAGMEITADTTFTYTYVAKTPISYTVTFNVENGSWNNGGSDAQTVTLTGYEGDTLTLAASQIPAVGSNPDATYKAGSWDTIPTAGMEITADTTFTYTYAAKTPISYTVTFNVENGSWNNGGSDAQTVTLTGYEGDTLNLAASQIPEVGSNPDATYKAGSWDTTPTAGMEITADTTFTYSYVIDNTAPITYTNTEGEGSNYTLGTNGTLTFRFSRSENDAETINHFTGIKVDNIEVSSSNYTYSAGSVIINLKPEYLQTLSVGQHTLTAMFDDGGDVTVNFTIVAAAQNTPTPTPAPTPAGTAIASTGETFPMTVLYGIAMLIASVLCIAVMSFIKPKKYKVRKVKL